MFVVFNRPETTRRVFESIRAAKPRRLFIAADGPRPEVPEDRIRCQEVRKIAATVDWPCQVHTLFRHQNLGCRKAVSGAIDWFFASEPEGIILEDDCLPNADFFRFAETLLDRFRDDERVMTIAAQHFHRHAHTPSNSYFFSRYNHCWGWASWRRAWQYYDHEMSLWPYLRETDWLLSIGDGNRFFRDYWTQIFDLVHAGKVDTWDYQWTFSCWAQSGLAVLPSRNLVTNLGFGAEATHTSKTNTIQANLPLETLDFPLRHPPAMIRDVVADRWSDRNLFGIGLRSAVTRRLKRALQWLTPKTRA